jgi:acetate kinase
MKATMNILVINAGSSSIKFSLYSGTEMNYMAGGLVERIGFAGTAVRYRNAGGKRISKKVSVKKIRDGVDLISELLTEEGQGVIISDKEISAVGHRVVHGGEQMKASVLIDDDVKAVIRSCFDLAPLHNPPNLKGIEACEGRFPGVPQAAVFDTAFHSTLPQKAYLYALPYGLYETDRIRRYGFHGTSHRYVSREAAKILGRSLQDLRMVTCHLGNGCSIAAVDSGKSVDTSMGFTPLEGLPMGTRCGDIDPSIVLHLIRQHGLTPDQLEALLNRESGFLGLGGTGSSDMRDLESSLVNGDLRARRVIDLFAYRIKKYIGAYAFAMGGLDAIVFTAGIGENSFMIRKLVCERLEDMGICIDEARNRQTAAGIRAIHHPDSRVQILVVPTDEEKEIALETMELCHS